MKKLAAIFMVIALLASAVPAFAEEPVPDLAKLAASGEGLPYITIMMDAPIIG